MMIDRVPEQPQMLDNVIYIRCMQTEIPCINASKRMECDSQCEKAFSSPCCKSLDVP